MVIYVPMTCHILVVGHVRILKKLTKKGKVIVGLLTDKALKNYKKNVTPFKDRLCILSALDLNIKIVSQNTLNPYNNLRKYKCTALASGDGFEECEIEASKKLGIKLIEVDSGSPTHSSDIKI